MVVSEEINIEVKKTALHAIKKQREKNKKKKERKKIQKLKKKIAEPTQTQTRSEINRKVPELKLPEFELKGAFERFKLELEDDENKDLPDHKEINLKARTAEILAQEAAEKAASKSKYPAEEEEDEAKGPNNSFAKASDKPLSKKKLKLLNRPSIALLKKSVPRPDVVDMYDVCAKDPLFLVYLKSYRNSVPVPRHWCAKRKYLQGKRGYEKPPFRLPDYIARTGIMEMRQTVQDKDADKGLKAKMREKIRPKVGKIDIDYHKLHDAFFKYQSKPYLTSHGELYYEGKEFEVKLREKKPGNLTEALRIALGLPTGANADKYPPPWLIAMQRYGPPPSYPNIKIPGLNAPIPPGCAFGYHPGGWGKPPVDELGRPIYGDVFGNGGNVAGAPPPPPPINMPQAQAIIDQDAAITKGKISYWGEWESDEESDDNVDSDVEEGSEEDNEMDIGDEPSAPANEPSAEEGETVTPIKEAYGIATPGGGYVTPSGTTSLSVGAASLDPANIELRKKTIEESMDNPDGTMTPLTGNQLYKVLPVKESKVATNEIMGSTMLYDTSKAVDEEQAQRLELDNQKDRQSKKAQNPDQQPGATSSNAQKPTAAPTQTKKYKDFKF